MTSSGVLYLLLRLSIVGTVAILLTGLLRPWARRLVGPEAAYWLWLLVPASLIAGLLPRLNLASASSLAHASAPLIRAIDVPAEFAPNAAGSDYALTATLVWAVGATVGLAFFAYCQRILRRSLGALTLRPDGTYSSTAARQAMLVGAWHSRIVLPSDFETRYSASERAFILAHERAHVGRRDGLTNCIALVFACLFWFNPLTYWARNRFRFDQEAACDAAVLRQLRVPPRRYARALAKSHLETLGAIGFGWRRRHPLLERVSLLKRAPASRRRRLAGNSLAMVLMLSSAYVSWAAQPDLSAPAVKSAPRIAISIRWLIDGTQVFTVGNGSRLPDVTLRPGIGFALTAPSPSGESYGLKCVPSLHPEDSVAAPDKAHRQPAREHPQLILLKCEISRGSEVFARPGVVTAAGKTAVIMVGDPKRYSVIRIELTPAIT